MGRSKASLPFGQEAMLERVVRILAAVVSPIVVVAAPDQKLPPLPGEALITRDEREERGPLEGMRAGMKELSRRGYSDDLAVYVTSCDVPLLVPEFIREVLAKLAAHQASVPVEGRLFHPLAAAFRLGVLPEIEALLVANQLRPAFLFDRVATCLIPAELLREVDPQLLSLKNCNHPEDYAAALKMAGFLEPE